MFNAGFSPFSPFNWNTQSLYSEAKHSTPENDKPFNDLHTEEKNVTNTVSSFTPFVRQGGMSITSLIDTDPLLTAINQQQKEVKQVIDSPDFLSSFLNREIRMNRMKCVIQNGYEEVFPNILMKSLREKLFDEKDWRQFFEWACECGHLDVFAHYSQNYGLKAGDEDFIGKFFSQISKAEGSFVKEIALHALLDAVLRKKLLDPVVGRNYLLRNAVASNFVHLTQRFLQEEQVQHFLSQDVEENYELLEYLATTSVGCLTLILQDPNSWIHQYEHIKFKEYLYVIHLFFCSKYKCEIFMPDTIFTNLWEEEKQRFTSNCLDWTKKLIVTNSLSEGINIFRKKLRELLSKPAFGNTYGHFGIPQRMHSSIASTQQEPTI